MSLDKISIQYNKALELKKDAKYATALKAELSKPEWKQQFDAIDERLAVVGSKNDFDKCFKQLVDRRTRQALWGAEQMLTQKHVAKRYMIAKK